MLRTYETTYVTNVETSQDSLDAISSKIKGYVTGSGGEIGTEESWGTRDLSCKLKKQDKGRYNYISYTAKPEMLKELEFYLKISEPVITFLTVKVKDIPDLENIRKPNPKDLLN